VIVRSFMYTLYRQCQKILCTLLYEKWKTVLINVCANVRLAESNCAMLEYLESRQGCLQTRPFVADYLPALRAMAKAEEHRKSTNRKRRFAGLTVFFFTNGLIFPRIFVMSQCN